MCICTQLSTIVVSPASWIFFQITVAGQARAALPDKLRTLMQKMTIFETVTGRSLFLTYLTETKDSSLSLIERDDIKPIEPAFDEVMSILFTYAGVDGVRELLVHADWQERLAKDALLQEIKAWA